jgi:3D (Asp-Asp-Asp) domain-containing protein
MKLGHMQSQAAYRSFGLLIASVAGTALFTSCTTISPLAAYSDQNIKAVAKIAEEGATAQETIKVGEETPSAPEGVIVGAPPIEDPVAIERPAEKPSSPPILLASVPRTPVGGQPTNQIMMVRTTAYSHLEADSLKYGKLNAAGSTLKYGSQVRSAAADWSKYPLGTRFMIEGLPYEYVVDDYGSALVGTETIDIYKPDMNTMGQWGVRNVPVRVLEWGSFEESRKILDGRKHVRHADHVRKMLSEIERKGLSGYEKAASGGSA